VAFSAVSFRDLDRRDDTYSLARVSIGNIALLEVVAGGGADRDVGALVAADDLDGLVGGDDRAGEVAVVLLRHLQDVALVEHDHAGAVGRRRRRRPGSACRFGGALSVTVVPSWLAVTE
jgi:hypothetical protein